MTGVILLRSRGKVYHHVDRATGASVGLGHGGGGGAAALCRTLDLHVRRRRRRLDGAGRLRRGRLRRRRRALRIVRVFVRVVEGCHLVPPVAIVPRLGRRLGRLVHAALLALRKVWHARLALLLVEPCQIGKGEVEDAVRRRRHRRARWSHRHGARSTHGYTLFFIAIL